MTLNSHPEKSLQTHVAEVREAAHKAWSSHSDKLHENSRELFDWLNWAVTMHDVGKGCTAFQTYIRDVKGFKGRPRLKAHTPMSFVASLTHGRQNDWAWHKTLCVAACAAGHHSSFKTHAELERLLRSTDGQDILVGQLDGFDWRKVGQAVSASDAGCQVNLVAGFATDDDLSEIAEWLEDDVIDESLHELSLADAIAFRLQCQFVHSLLLEADKAYLIISPDERNRYRETRQRRISPAVVVDYIDENRKVSRLDPLRSAVRTQLTERLARSIDCPIQTVTLPTGSGKTLLAATWAIQQRAQLQTDSHTPPIVIVLPFLSIIEQTQDIYRRMLNENSGLLSYHSLSVRDHHDSEDPDTAEFFLDTWHGDVIITTFDQFLFALLESRTKHQMRFHQLCDSLIVMDEVQALPCELWDIVAKSLGQLVSIGNCRLLAISATQTGFLPEAAELIEEPCKVFSTLERYEILLRHDQPTPIDEFIEELQSRASNLKNPRALIVLNTRKSARCVRDAIAKTISDIEFLSADVTPRDRLAAIERIKAGKPCIVVSTQCIEAGVDIDMSLVIRDFAPVDSLIQVAGRCNRNFDRSRETIEVVSLVNDSGNSFAPMIYDKVLLQETRQILKNHVFNTGRKRILEEEVFDLTRNYFQALSVKKNLGESHTSHFARWEELPPIHQLLRGRQANQESFIVIEQDPDLEHDLKKVSQVKDRWQRRRLLRQLSSRIATITVTVYTQTDFEPGRFAKRDATGNFWLLNTGFYTSKRGIDLSHSNQSNDDNDTWGRMV